MIRNLYCIAAVIFPANEPYLEQFLNSISQQSYSKFDLVLFNDGMTELPLVPKNISTKIVKCKGFIYEVRQTMVDYLLESEYEFISFLDSDDFVSENYVANNKDLLEDFACVANDLILFEKDDKITKKDSAFWQDRLSPNTAISSDFLTHQNILGLGNTSIRKEILRPLKFTPEIKALDWFMFSTVLGNQMFTFTTDSHVFYRQHNANLLGSAILISAQRLKHIISIKENHYLTLGMTDEYCSISDFKIKVSAKMDDYIDYINNLNLHFFWLEETNYFNYFINDKY